MAASFSKSGSVKALQQEFKNLNDSPVEGFQVKIRNESNMFEWDVAIFGPPGTLYEGGYLKDGRVCISILHPPGDDPVSGELPSERWNPTQNVRTILLSVISLLNEPNTSSPANVDASVMYRKWKEGKSSDYSTIVRQQVEATKKDAAADGVKVPTRIEDYVLKPSLRQGRALDHDVFAVQTLDSSFDDDITLDFDEDDP